MSFPRVLSLRTTEEGVRRFMEPVKEIELLHEKEHAFNNAARIVSLKVCELKSAWTN